jgi:hypothetical protein
MFHDYEEYDVHVCRESRIKSKPCKRRECKNHYCHVPDGPVEYFEVQLKDINCPHYRTRAQRLVRQYGRYFRE